MSKGWTHLGSAALSRRQHDAASELRLGYSKKKRRTKEVASFSR